MFCCVVSANCISFEYNKPSSQVSSFLSEHVHVSFFISISPFKEHSRGFRGKDHFIVICLMLHFLAAYSEKGCPRKVFCHQHIKTWMGTCKEEGPLEEDIPDQCVWIEYLQGWSLALLCLCRVFLSLGKNSGLLNYYL